MSPNVKQSILAWFDKSYPDPYEAVPAINKVLELLGYSERLDFESSKNPQKLADFAVRVFWKD